MTYWGSNPEDCDYAFDAVGSYVSFIKERMFSDMATVLEGPYTEQSIVASLKCLRLLAREFPKCVRVHFRRREFEQSRSGFERGFKAVRPQLPSEHRDAIEAEAKREFQLFEQDVLVSCARSR